MKLPGRSLRGFALPAVLAAVLALSACEGAEPPTAATPPPEPTAAAATPAPVSTVDLPESSITNTDACPGTGPRVCLVPLAEFADPPVQALVQYLAGLDIPATQAPAVGLETADIDRSRFQLAANRAAERVLAAYPHLAGDSDLTVIALTDFDIFIEDFTFNWVFGMRGEHVHVLSTARMYEEIWGGFRDDEQRDSRLRKMLLRYVGFFHLELPENDAPLTVLYRHLNSLGELDAMREGILEPSQLPQPSTNVEAWADAFCAAAEAYAVRSYRQEVDFGRDFPATTSPAAARELTIAHLDASRLSMIEYRNAADAAFARVAEHEQLIALHRTFDDFLHESIRASEVAATEIARLESMAGIAGRLFELFLTIAGHDGVMAVYDAYEALPLDVFVAIGDAGSCGGFEPGAFLEASRA